MSKRFGRNQKRRMREQIANLETAMQMDRGLLRDQSYKIEMLRNEIEDAKRIAAPYSIVFKAAVMNMGGMPQDRMRMIQPPAMRFDYSPNSPIEDFVAREMSLPVMLSEVNEGMAAAVHLRVRYDGQQWGYAISRPAMMDTPKPILIERIARELALQIANDIQRALP